MRKSEKRWLFLFTCMSISAIHIENVSTIDTSFCVFGIERFVARRRTPSIIWSNNGTKFMATEKKLLMCIQLLNAQATIELEKKGNNWKSNPSTSPHHRVSWERLVRCYNRKFCAINRNRGLTTEVLQTSFYLLEEPLNACSITAVGCFEVITPNNYLLGRNSTSAPSLSFQEHFDYRKQNKRAQSYVNTIGSR